VHELFQRLAGRIVSDFANQW